MLAHGSISTLAGGLVVAVFARALIDSLWPSPLAPEGEILLDLLLLLSALVASGLVMWWPYRGVASALSGLRSAPTPAAAELLRQLAHNQVREVMDLAQGLIHDRFEISAPEQLAPWVDTFFRLGGSPYSGVDTHGPASHMAVYAWYLDLHAREIKRRPFEPERDTRSLCISLDSLRTDYVSAPAAYRAFFEWHAHNDVALTWIDPADVDFLRKKYGLQGSDIALWPQFAVIFEVSREGQPQRLGIRFADDLQGPSPTYQDVRRFVDDVEAHAKPLAPELPGIETLDATLAKAWSDFVDVEKRADPNGPVGQFLLRSLANRKIVLDAAAGVGAESVLLLKHGFTVISNEVDERLAAQARAFADANGVRLYLTSMLWESLGAAAAGNLRYEAILLLGDSLSLILDADTRRRALMSFWDLLEPGGILIVDERNYSQIVSHANRILADPIGEFAPARRGDVMYAGHLLRSYPAVIRSDRVLWDFFLKDARESGAPQHHLGSAPIPAHPFQFGEVYRELQAVGFESIEVSADLQPVSHSGMPRESEVAEADFLTYVAVKRPDG